MGLVIKLGMGLDIRISMWLATKPGKGLGIVIKLAIDKGLGFRWR